MKVSQAIEILKGLGEDDDVFCPLYLKEEADERGQEEHGDEFRFQGSEWAKIVTFMETDDGLWQSLNETFFYYVEKALEKAESNETN